MCEPEITANLSHHWRQELCESRALYRRGRRLTAVKVYTVSKESQHVLIYNVPSLCLESELLGLCRKFGETGAFSLILKYQNESDEIEPFTSVYHVHYQTLKSARFAKKMLDNRSFYGGLLHVCYAPELETVDETKSKLSQRRKEIYFRSRLINGCHAITNRSFGHCKNKVYDDKMVVKNCGSGQHITNVHHARSSQTSIPTVIGVRSCHTVDIEPIYPEEKGFVVIPVNNLHCSKKPNKSRSMSFPSEYSIKKQKLSNEFNKVLEFIPRSIPKSILESGTRMCSEMSDRNKTRDSFSGECWSERILPICKG